MKRFYYFFFSLLLSELLSAHTDEFWEARTTSVNKTLL